MFIEQRERTISSLADIYDGMKNPKREEARERRGSTKVLVIFILLGVILLATPRAQTMDFANYTKWFLHISGITGALTDSAIAVMDILQPAQAMKIFSELSNATFELQSWAEEVSPPNATDFASHKYIKSAVRYLHLSFMALSRGNWNLGISYGVKSDKEWKAAAEALPKKS